MFNVKDGFDIVIGNPPYGGTNIPREVRDALVLGSNDPCGAFIARFMGDGYRATPLKLDGVLSYIVSDTFMTLKSHRDLRRQLMRHRIHKMIRLHPDTFGAVVNTAVILLQRCQHAAGTDFKMCIPSDQTCQMVDLTNISIHDEYERFLNLLFATADGKGRDISTESCAVYNYPQSLIRTNSNLPFFVASPKLFALMNDTSAPVTHEEIGGKHVPVRTVPINGRDVCLVKLGDIAEVRVGLQTGDNDSYLFQQSESDVSYRSIDQFRDFLLTASDFKKISIDTSLRNEVVQYGISKEDHKSLRYFGGRYIVPYDKGGSSESDDGWLPNYWVNTDYYIDWSEWAVNRMQTLTQKQKFQAQGKAGGDDKLTSRLQNTDFYFVPGITWSDVGVYSPTVRLSGVGVFDVKGSRLVVSQNLIYPILGVVCSKLAKMWIKAVENHTVSTQSDNVRELIIPTQLPNELDGLIHEVVSKQKLNSRYDYASNEQLEIDRLVYEAYGLNEDDIAEVETWYARRYPKLVTAQRENLRKSTKR